MAPFINHIERLLDKLGAQIPNIYDGSLHERCMSKIDFKNSMNVRGANFIKKKKMDDNIVINH